LEQLTELLAARNGFYAFESALHVFGSGSTVVGGSLEDWNDNNGWIASYGGLADGAFFFAEDVFGGQFAIIGDEICTFDPETAATEAVSSSIEDWAGQLVQNYSVLTGFVVAHDWQTQHGVIEPGCRLVPKRPFVLGGEFSAANVCSLAAVKGIHVRADLALQIRDLPDGSKIRYRIVG
jgi:hypothetical protein